MPESRTMHDPPLREITVPPGAPSWITPELIEHTIRVWQPYYSDLLTSEDAVKILMDVSQLFGVLSRS